MDDYEANRAFEVDAMPAVKAALQTCSAIVWGRAGEKTTVTSLRNATPEQDMRENTDLKFAVISSGCEEVDVAARVRRHKYWRRMAPKNRPYREQFTIRRQAKRGGKTEIHKVLDGFGTFMLYGFESEGGPDRLVQFTVIDLDVFREQIALWRTTETEVPWSDVPNTDGTRGAAFNFGDFPTRMVVCRYDADRNGLVIPSAPAVMPTRNGALLQGVLF